MLFNYRQNRGKLKGDMYTMRAVSQSWGTVTSPMNFAAWGQGNVKLCSQ
jgi:hypothetical protein